MKKPANIALCMALIAVVLATGAYAASIQNTTASPAEGTSNSVFEISFTWHEPDGGLPEPGTLTVCTYTQWSDDPWTCVYVAEMWGRGSPAAPEGRKYTIRVSAGLNLANEVPNPNDTAILYFSPLVAEEDGAPRTVNCTVRAVYTPPDEDPDDEVFPEPQLVEQAGPVIIVHDSKPHSRYAGQEWDKDYLRCYVDYGDNLAWDPLATMRYDGQSPDVADIAGMEDDGTSSTIYTFTVVYYNDDNLPPIQYLNFPEGYPWWGKRPGEEDTGVVLYFGEQGEDYRPFPMQKVDEDDNDYTDGVVYRYVLEPEWWNYYRALPNGTYKYFFGCTDDYIRDADHHVVGWADLEPYDPGVYGTSGTFHENPTWLSWWNFYNLNVYADRPTYQPGVSSPYPQQFARLECTEHPQVTLGLDHVGGAIGGYEFLGTLYPYRRAVNPLNGANSSGSTSATRHYFQVIYSQLDGLPPEEISVWIDNTSNGSGTYTRYTLHQTDLEGSDFTAGVLFRTDTTITLPPGPHTYYFTATDGYKRVKYPKRGRSGPDYVAGPYVNHRSELTDLRVDPPTGTSGDNFRYSVVYLDPDGQRPYTAHIVIQLEDGGTLDNGGAVRMDMIKEDFTDTDYIGQDGRGVKYIFDSANLNERLQEGQRRFYVELTDDWGGPSDTQDRIQGELVKAPADGPGGTPSWFDGPYINRNTRPVLTNGVVVSADGTSNSATVWNYTVRYRDVDNHSPKYVNVYIGQEDDTGNIVWDAGSPMAGVDRTDTVYSDGKDYRYSTRLGGSTGAENYYYCFVASDGIDVAVYDAANSPSAHTIWDPVEVLTTPDPMDPVFFTSKQPLVGPVPVGPTESEYEWPLVYSDTGGQFFYPSDYAIDFKNGRITMSVPISVIHVQYWFGMPGPTGVGANTPPSLAEGRVAPNPGTTADDFTYLVIYRDTDGPFGQAPYYVRVRIDGAVHDMTPSGIGGTPNYKTGVTYQLTTSLTPGVHTYYFEASDGAGFALFDATGARSSDQPIGTVTPFVGPYVNDPPTLTLGTIYPNPPEGITTSQWVNYSVTYTDTNNEPPNTGYPVVYVDNPTEVPHDGTITALSAITITATVDGDDPNWTADEFKGLPLQITSGPADGLAYKITGNTTNTVTLLTVDLAGDGVAIGDTFSIGKLKMRKADPTDNNYADGVVYEYRVGSLGEGDHSAHFKSQTTETIGAGGLTRTTVVRYPVTGVLSGPLVTSSAKPGNIAPELTDPSVNPQIGRTVDTFVFNVTYSDGNGDPPMINEAEGVRGYVRVIIDGQLPGSDMIPPTMPDYVTGAVFSFSLSGLALSAGAHEYYFEASDGWAITRLPAPTSPSYRFTINRKPVLSQPRVTPTSGNAGRTYRYSVRYIDADGQAPASVLLHIDAQAPIEIKNNRDPTSGTDFDGSDPADPGVVYYYDAQPGTLTTGTHSFFFEASDGLENAVPTAEASGPYIHENTAPDLRAGSVTPTSGWTDGTYVYSVIFSDPNGDEPEYVKVYIDGDADEDAHAMTKDPDEDDFATGVTYTYTQDGLTVGGHTFRFQASDYLDDARDPDTGSYTGPSVNERPAAAITIACSSAPRIGAAATVSGQVSPAMSIALTLTFTRPNATTFTRTVVTQSNGTYSTAWTPKMTGSWKLKASWAGAADFRPSESEEIDVVVLGPSQIITGLDMISIPLVLANRFPGAVFGPDPPFAVAEYQPSMGTYAYYYSLPGPTPPDVPLFEIREGKGYWIKVLTGEEKQIAPSGNLVSTDASFPVTLLAGWNQIGCPFTEEVNWGGLGVRYNGETLDLAAAASRGWIREYGWAYDPGSGSYRLVDATRSGAERTMRPWRGYWTKALVNCQLLIPPPSGSRGGPVQTLRTELQVAGSHAAAGWEVGLSARVGSLVDDQNGFGSAPSDVRIESPACFEHYVDLYFTDERQGLYAYDLRSRVSAGDFWTFRVATDQTEGLVELTWSGLESVPTNMMLTLVDELTGYSAVLGADGSYSFPVSEAVEGRQFRIVVDAK